MNSQKFFIGRIIGLIVLFGVAVWFIFFNNLATKDQPKSEVKNYKDAIYIVENQSIVLNGNTKYFGNEVTGDFNVDGFNDAVFLLTQQPGGSGTFFYVALALGSENGYQGSNTVFLGDRIAPQTTEYKNGEIIVNYAKRKTGEPMTTQPSMGVSKYFKVEDGLLVLVNKPDPIVPPVSQTPTPTSFLCKPEQRLAEFCAQVYQPVCAEVKIQCVTTPCNPIKQTFSSSCEACKNGLVDSYEAGECK